MKRSLVLPTGLAAGLVLVVTSLQWPAAAGPAPVGVCHRLDTNGTARVLLDVDVHAVEAHLAQGDVLADPQTGCQPTATPTAAHTATATASATATTGPTATPSDNGDGYD